MDIRIMTIEDYEKVYGLWRTIRGFGIRSMDDSREGVRRFLHRNPTAGEAACTMSASGRAIGAGAWERPWWSPAWKR